jgi:hypothetical protein
MSTLLESSFVMRFLYGADKLGTSSVTSVI